MHTQLVQTANLSEAVVWQHTVGSSAAAKNRTEEQRKDGAMALLTQGSCSSFLKAKEDSRMYLSTNILLHLEYAG